MHYATKSMLLDALRNLPRTIYNLISSARVNTFESNMALLRNLVLSMPQSEQEPFAAECKFIRNMSIDDLRAIVFPYRMRAGEENVSLRKIETGRDKGLPYVVHPSGRRVYFPKSTSEAAMLENYRGLMYVEGITGAGLLEKSPHCYQDADFRLEDGDCLLDLGCAEALFTIDNMDIEGGERQVISGNEDFFRKRKVRLSCCVYHRQNDAEIIRDMLVRLGYKARFSDGYMLVDMNGIHFPYFRRGVIYAWNY